MQRPLRTSARTRTGKSDRSGAEADWSTTGSTSAEGEVKPTRIAPRDGWGIQPIRWMWICLGNRPSTIMDFRWQLAKTGFGKLGELDQVIFLKLFANNAK